MDNVPKINIRRDMCYCEFLKQMHKPCNLILISRHRDHLLHYRVNVEV